MVVSLIHDHSVRTRQAYLDHLKTFLKTWGRPPYRRPPLLVDVLAQVPRTASILDLGCGAGQDSRDLKRAGYRVIGLDLTRPLLSFARRRSPRLHLVQGDIRHLPYRSEQFDIVWAAASLIHLPKSSVRSTLRHLCGLLKPAGLLAATFVHGRQSGMLHEGWIPDRFISRWRKPELTVAVAKAGWTIERLTTVSNLEREGRWLNLIARRPFS